VSRLLSNPNLAAAMGEAGRAMFRARFTKGPMIESHMDLYSQLIGRSAS
jgi:glycosyltransferase involved in cell wall biosynthesis